MLALAPVAVLAALGWWLLVSDWLPLSTMLGGLCLGVAFVALLGLVRQIIRPRVGYRDGHVLFYLLAGRPVAVPLRVVEAFFQGEGPAHLPGETHHQAKSVNLIARLSQREPDWQQRDVKRALGNWSEGYVTIRGAWCEPITDEVIRRLNRRLREVSQIQQAESESVANV